MSTTIPSPSSPGAKPLRLGVLGSGKGSNYQAIAAAITAGTLNAEVRIVISDVATAGILAASSCAFAFLAATVGEDLRMRVQIQLVHASILFLSVAVLRIAGYRLVIPTRHCMELL